MSDLPLPQERFTQIGRGSVEARLRATMAGNALSHGWLVTAGKGAGKATQAYRIARGVLEPEALSSNDSFSMDGESRAAKLIAQGAHPDLFVAERQWNEKTSKYQSEITVETIRQLTHFLNHTPAFGGARVAIVDTADDLNRSAANALLKVLEEPPANSLLLLLSASPGRLLPTIRSRCRRIILRDVDTQDVAKLVVSEGLADEDEASRIADHASGRPGYALSLAAQDGAKVLGLADAFLTASRHGKDIGRISASFTARTPAEEWGFFTSSIASQLSDAARAAGRGQVLKGPLADITPGALIKGWEQVTQMVARGDGLNLDRGQIIAAMAFDLRRILAE